MSIYIGNTKIGQMYLGSTEIAQAYLGSTKVYQNGLPYDAQVEYLQSSGTQYIDTGIAPTADTEVYVKASIVDFTYVGFVCGARTGTSNANRFFPFAEDTQNGKIRVVYGSNVTVQMDVTYGDVYEILFNETSTHKFYLNNTEVATLSGYQKGNNSTIYFFATSGYEGELYRGKSRIYNCTIKESGNIVRDFIPVRVGTTGYMYDRVSHQLFGNDGSRSFTLGNDVTT